MLFNIEPYALKLFSQRWYVLAHIHFKKETDKQDWKTFLIFAFDRIKNMQLTNEKFVMKKGFSANDYFNDAFGIIVDETECIEWLLRDTNKTIKEPHGSFIYLLIMTFQKSSGR